MSDNFFVRFGRAFVEILFVRLRSESVRRLNIVSRILAYMLALALFYVPILYFAVTKCLEERGLIIYFVIIALIHILAKIMLCSSKRIQQRFSAIKQKKHFLIRTWLIVEYVFFMWLVYLFYPLACILIPVSLLAMSVESMLGFSFILNLLFHNWESFILFGGIISYILFIVADGYRKLKSGFLPDYLGLYAVLTIMSAFFEGVPQRLAENFAVNISQITDTLSRIFALSNDSMNIVASAMTFFFALHSLYKNCGANVAEKDSDIDIELQSESESVADPLIDIS